MIANFPAAVQFHWYPSDWAVINHSLELAIHSTAQVNHDLGLRIFSTDQVDHDLELVIRTQQTMRD